MALITVEGVYDNGTVRLAERPRGVSRAKVMVTFLAESTESAASGDALRRRFLERLERGVDFGSAPLPTREELYADRLGRF